MAKKKTMPKKKQSVKKASSPRRRSVNPGIPAWLNAVRNPWRHAPTSIPDEYCQPSIKYESRYSNTYTPVDNAATPTTNHGMLIGVGPYLFNSTGVADCGAIAARGYDSSINKYTGTVTANAMPNSGAMFPFVTVADSVNQSGYSYRVTAMSAKLTYTGTELNRSGRITAGLAMPDESGTSIPVSTRPANPINTVFGGTAATLAAQAPQSIRNRLRRITTVRNPDGSVEVRWIPAGVPRYASMVQTTSSLINEYAENLGPCILFAVEGDTTSTASATGNSYQLDVVMHVEVQPLSRYALAVGPTPSPYDPTALSVCLNAFEQMSSVSEWDAGGHHFQDDGSQRDSGTAWEHVASLGSSLLGNTRYALNGIANAASHPVTRGLVTLAATAARQRGQRRYLTAPAVWVD
jgi:hypothetical protein